MPITTPDELRHWLTGLKQEHLVDTLIAGGWLGDKLLTLTREDLADLAVPRDQRGDLMLAVEALRRGEGPLTLPDEHAPSYAPQFTPTVIDQCRALGRQPPQPWVDAVAEAWPGPIAHEYHRLRELLTEGHIVPAIFQLKDLVEVSLKFPALVMARDLLQHGDEEAGMAARRALFGGMLSLGHWLAGVRDTLAPQVLRLAPGGPLLLPELGSVFVTIKPSGKVAPTPWCETLARLVSWRNDQLGHGAFRLDPAEYLAELRDHLAAINQALAAQRDLWNGVELRGDAPHGPDLTGWRAIRHWHAGGAGEHRDQQAPVLLERNGRRLRLGPLVTLRRCAVCNKQDVFLYDSLAGYSLNDGFKLLDYLTGHRLGLPIHRAEELRVEAGDPPTAAPAAVAGELGEDYGEVALNELLETKLLEARYLRPAYLREPFQRFVEARDRGVFWLTAPAHTGKSVFVHALAAPAEVGEKPLLARTAVVALHIRREFKTWPEQLRYFLLEEVLHRAFGREPGRLRLPELDVRAEKPAEAFAALLHETMRLKPLDLERLVICLDGLDELPPSPADEAGIADFLPPPEMLPEGCFLLLTSRPLDDCPPHVRAALAGRFDAAGDAFAAFALTLDAQDAAGDAYRQLLRAYFDRELTTRQRAELHQALAAFIAGRDTVECRNDLGRLPPPVAAFAKQEWAELTRAVRVRSPADAPGLVETVAQPLLARFDATFAAVLDKANERFLYLAHLTDLLRDGQLRFEDIAALPSGAGLYRHYLSQLQRQLAPDAETAEKLASKPWDFAHRVIVTLAAIEQAHVAYQEMLPLSVREEVFRGVPLDILAALLDEPRRSVRLVFTLYTLKSILAVWKGEDARDARYALGLKDFAATVQALWPEALAARHRFLAHQALEALDGRWEAVTDNDYLDNWRLKYLLGHIKGAKTKALLQKMNSHSVDYLSQFNIKPHDFCDSLLYTLMRLIKQNINLDNRSYKSAIRWCSQSISYCIELLELQDCREIGFWNLLADIYKIRSDCRWFIFDKNGSIQDIECSIKILENLHEVFGDELDFKSKINLSSFYFNSINKITRMGFNKNIIVARLNKIDNILNYHTINDDFGISTIFMGYHNVMKTNPVINQCMELPPWPVSLDISVIIKAASSKFSVIYNNMLIFLNKPGQLAELMGNSIIFKTAIIGCINHWGPDTVFSYFRVIVNYIALSSSHKEYFDENSIINPICLLNSLVGIMKDFLSIIKAVRLFDSNDQSMVKGARIGLEALSFICYYYIFDHYKNYNRDSNSLKETLHYLNLAIHHGENFTKNHDYFLSRFAESLGLAIDIEAKLCIAYIERGICSKNKNKKLFLYDLNKAIDLYELNLKNKDSFLPYEKLMISNAYRERALLSSNNTDAIRDINNTLEILTSLHEELDKVGLWCSKEQEALSDAEKILLDLSKDKLLDLSKDKI